ncbi:MAG: hypothetical protein FWG67_06705 [Defluviitaleaceae bacterium]|nr:hypothetical protein [Defluviitaleaceae bacterium]
MKNLKWRLLLVIVIVTLTACGGSNDESELDTHAYYEYEEAASYEESESETEAPELEAEEDEIEEVESGFTGFDDFLELDLGISMEEAIELLGSPTSETTMDLLGVETTTMVWLDINLSDSNSTTITFSDGEATSVMEAIFGRSDDVTLDDFSNLSTGMTELAVYEAIGVPYSVMVMEVLGATSTTVSWINSDLSVITIMFTDGVVSALSQIGLD